MEVHPPELAIVASEMMNSQAATALILAQQQQRNFKISN